MNALRTIGRLRTARLTAIALLSLGAVATRLPLLDVPGYELAEVETLALALFAAALGIAASRTPFGRQWPARTALACGGLAAASAVAATALVALFSALGSRCSPWAGLPFVALLPLPTALLASALGVLCGRASRRLWPAALLYLSLLLAGLAWTLWPLYFGPQTFAFNHLLGWFPGPLYDEELSPPLALWVYRSLTLTVAAALLTLLSAFSTPRPARRLLSAIALFALFALGVGLEHRMGAITSVADLERSLGGRRATTGLVLHYPRELSEVDVERLVRLAELDQTEVTNSLGLPAGPPVHLFFFRDAAEKGRLTGASTTHYTKPWLHQIHTHVGADGERVLRHELVHALAAPWGNPLFGVPARGAGLVVQAGITEGLAMAVDWPAEELTLHQWSRAMRETGLAPDIRAIMGPFGFAAASQGRAYTLAGSFLRFLLDQFGHAAMQRLYLDGDFATAYGRPLDALATEWEHFLATVPLDDQARGAAQNRFRRPSIFARPCARETAALRAEADVAAGAGNRRLESELLGRCAAIDPGDPALLKALWDAQRADANPQAAQTLARLLAAPALDPVLRAQVSLTQGDAARKAGDLEGAQARYQEVLAVHVDPSVRRSVEIRLAALNDPVAADAFQDYFDSAGSSGSLIGLLEVWTQRKLPQAPYLLGLRLSQEGERAKSLFYLRAALEATITLPPGFEDPFGFERFELTQDLRAKALQIAAGEEIDLGQYQAAQTHLEALERLSLPAGEQLLQRDLAERLAFERKKYGHAVAGLR